MSFDWKGLLSNIAPVLGTAIGGPFGALAGTAIKAALGLSEDSDEAAMAAALQKATPEQLLAIKQADNQFKLDMEKLGVDLARIDADDRNSARQREMTVKDWVPGLLAVTLTVGFFGLLAYLVAHEPPAGSRDILNVMLGSLGTGWVTMLAYYYGSSSSSSEKNKLLLAAQPGRK